MSSSPARDLSSFCRHIIYLTVSTFNLMYLLCFEHMYLYALPHTICDFFRMRQYNNSEGSTRLDFLRSTMTTVFGSTLKRGISRGIAANAIQKRTLILLKESKVFLQYFFESFDNERNFDS